MSNSPVQPQRDYSIRWVRRPSAAGTARREGDGLAVTGIHRGGGRDELSRSLLLLRKEAGMSQVEVGRETRIGQRKVSRFEKGLYLPTVDELAALLHLYQAPLGTRGRLREIAQSLNTQVRKPQAGLRRANHEATQHQILVIGSKAEQIQSFHPAIVVGLLQSPEYMRALFDQNEVTDVEATIAQRIVRQRHMAASGKRYTFIQTEGALRWQLDSPAVMAAQLDAIAEHATANPDVRVGIIPWTRAAHFTVTNGFHLYDGRLLLVGTTAGTSILRDEVDLQEHRRLFDRLEDLAVFGEQTAAIARRLADEYRKLDRQGAPTEPEVTRPASL